TEDEGHPAAAGRDGLDEDVGRSYEIATATTRPRATCAAATMRVAGVYLSLSMVERTSIRVAHSNSRTANTCATMPIRPYTSEVIRPSTRSLADAQMATTTMNAIDTIPDAVITTAFGMPRRTSSDNLPGVVKSMA